MRMRIGTGALVLSIAALWPAWGRSADGDDIRRAVERGLEFLRSRQDNDGSWSFGNAGHTVGTSALVGLTMLECDVPSNDSAVKDAARVVRSGVGSINDTYDISLAVMFLDRLGLTDDDSLIETLSHRLIAGQTANGGWGYFCPHVSSENRRMRTATDKKNAEPRDKQDANKQNRRGNLQNDPRNFQGFIGDDNSNTQFATLALWIARRHHVKVDAALRAVETRFRRSQNGDGGWGYKAMASSGRMGPGMMTGSSASMTCAGLLGLAVGYGVGTHALHTKAELPNAKSENRNADKEKPEMPRDAAVKAGLDFLAQVLQPALRGGDDDPPAMRIFGRGGFGMRGGGMGGIVHNGLGSEYYFLWSLERVAVVYSLKMLGDKDWYAIGSKYLLQNQENDGAWRGNLGGTVDTCFALFFLKRANLAVDLTAKLRSKGPAVVDLRAKGIPGEGEKDAAKMPSEKPDPAKVTPERDGLAATRSGARTSETEMPSIPPPPPTKETPVPQKPAVKDPTPVAAKLEPSPSSPGGESGVRGQESHDQQVARLRDELLQASPKELPVLVDKLRDSKGSMNTEALADAILKLTGTAKSKASEALAQRLARMTADTLRDKLRDENLEVRRAAALASAMKEDKSFIPDLIGLLEDRESRVERAAYASLKALTEEDFGPTANADEERRSRSIARWRDWWAKNMHTNPKR